METFLFCSLPCSEDTFGSKAIFQDSLLPIWTKKTKTKPNIFCDKGLRFLFIGLILSHFSTAQDNGPPYMWLHDHTSASPFHTVHSRGQVPLQPGLRYSQEIVTGLAQSQIASYNLTPPRAKQRPTHVHAQMWYMVLKAHATVWLYHT